MGKKTTYLIFSEEDKDFLRFFTAETKVKEKDLETRSSLPPEKLQGPQAEKFKKETEKLIKESDIAVVLIGKNTYRDKWIDWEIDTAAKLGKPLLGIKIHGSWIDTIPLPLENHGAMITTINYREMIDAFEKTFNQSKSYSYGSGEKSAKYPSYGERTPKDIKPDVGPHK
jgi:hypothetical protein